MTVRKIPIDDTARPVRMTPRRLARSIEDWSAEALALATRAISIEIFLADEKIRWHTLMNELVSIGQRAGAIAALVLVGEEPLAERYVDVAAGRGVQPVIDAIEARTSAPFGPIVVGEFAPAVAAAVAEPPAMVDESPADSTADPEFIAGMAASYAAELAEAPPTEGSSLDWLLRITKVQELALPRSIIRKVRKAHIDTAAELDAASKNGGWTSALPGARFVELGALEWSKVGNAIAKLRATKAAPPPADAPLAVEDLGLPRRIVRELRRAGWKTAADVDLAEVRSKASPFVLADQERIAEALAKAGAPTPAANGVTLDANGKFESVVVPSADPASGEEIVFDRNGTHKRDAATKEPRPANALGGKTFTREELGLTAEAFQELDEMSSSHSLIPAGNGKPSRLSGIFLLRGQAYAVTGVLSQWRIALSLRLVPAYRLDDWPGETSTYHEKHGPDYHGIVAELKGAKYVLGRLADEVTVTATEADIEAAKAAVLADRPASTRRAPAPPKPRRPDAAPAGHLDGDDPDLRPAAEARASSPEEDEDEYAFSDEQLEARAIAGDVVARRELQRRRRAELAKELPADRRGLLDDLTVDDYGVFMRHEKIAVPMPKSARGCAAEIYLARGNDGLWYEGLHWKTPKDQGGHLPSASLSAQHRTRISLFENVCDMLNAAFKSQRCVAAQKNVAAWLDVERRKAREANDEPTDPEPAIAAAAAEVASLKAAAPALPAIGDWRDVAVEDLDALNGTQIGILKELGIRTAGDLDDLVEGRRVETWPDRRPVMLPIAGKPSSEWADAVKAPLRAALDKVRATADEAWRAIPIEQLDLEDAARISANAVGLRTAGELHDYLTSGGWVGQESEWKSVCLAALAKVRPPAATTAEAESKRCYNVFDLRVTEPYSLNGWVRVEAPDPGSAIAIAARRIGIRREAKHHLRADEILPIQPMNPALGEVKGWRAMLIIDRPEISEKHVLALAKANIRTCGELADAIDLGPITHLVSGSTEAEQRLVELLRNKPPAPAAAPKRGSAYACDPDGPPKAKGKNLTLWSICRVDHPGKPPRVIDRVNAPFAADAVGEIIRMRPELAGMVFTVTSNGAESLSPAARHTPEDVVAAIDAGMMAIDGAACEVWTDRSLPDLGLEVPDQVVTLLEKAGIVRVYELISWVADQHRALSSIAGMTETRAELLAEQLYAAYQTWASLQTPAPTKPKRRPSLKAAAGKAVTS